ncbi:MAG: hypothetical protein JWM95_4244 [Gemmatimonadetes bacterium]|nr:hypothetical protein [Gemmatimonadota bacterium]
MPPSRAGSNSFLFISQVFVPDPASVGQHIADAAAELVQRGHHVTVLTSARGYDDPSQRYLRRECIHGIDVIRLPLSSFGKGTIGSRMLGGIAFVLLSIVRGVALGRIDCVVVSTSPPIAAMAGVVLAALKRARLKYWIMDLNPDQIVALGKRSAKAVSVRMLDWLNRLILRRADDVIVLDRFMAERVHRKSSKIKRLHVIPPWPLEDVLSAVPHSSNWWRRQQGLRDEVVVMYSGNHGPSNPLAAILSAAARLVDVPGLLFYFVGGGIGKREVDATNLPNVRSLPYQPLETLAYSLSAADVHVVTLGDHLVGIVHPCKVYGAMAVARPVLAFGPEQSHLGDLISRNDIGWRLSNDDVDGAEHLLRQIRQMGDEARAARGRRANTMIVEELSKDRLCGALCDVFVLP